MAGLVVNSDPSSEVNIFSFSSGNTTDQGADGWDNTGVTPAPNLGFNAGDPGSWSGPVTVTPLPAALPLFATGLGGLGLLGWRKKRKAQAA